MIFLGPKDEDRKMIVIKRDELFELTMPICGVCEAGDYWGVTVESHMVNELSMRSLDRIPALFYKKNGNIIEGVSSSYVDGELHAGNKKFETLTENTIARYDSKPRLYDSFDFFGTLIETFKNGVLYVGQIYHAKNLTIVPLDTS